MIELVFGYHAVFHALAAGRRKIHRLYIQKSLEKEETALLDLARRRNVTIIFQEAVFFQKKAAPGVTHQGVVLESGAYPYVALDTLFDESSLLILDEIQDPQNLGALCRSAYLLGVGGVVIPENHAASIGPGASHASVGAVEYLKISRVSSIAKCLESLKENNFWVYGAAMKGAKEIQDEVFPAKTAFVIGGEERGLKRLVRERCDILLRIPMLKKEIDSLNASVSGGIFLYEILRQKLKKLQEKH